MRDFKVGDEVYARPRDLRIGTFAEYIAIDQEDVALKPTSLTLHEAAAVPLVALAAWQTLVDVAQVKPGQKVLVHAGAGGLGLDRGSARQAPGCVRRHDGAHGNDVDRVRGLGADEVVDFTTTDFADVALRLRRRTRLPRRRQPGEVADRPQARRPGDQRGRATRCRVRPAAGPADPAPVMSVMSRKVRARARKLGVRYSFFFMRANGAQLRRARRAVRRRPTPPGPRRAHLPLRPDPRSARVRRAGESARQGRHHARKRGSGRTLTTTPRTANSSLTLRIDVGGTRFAYRELGPTTGVPFVFLPAPLHCASASATGGPTTRR